MFNDRRYSTRVFLATDTPRGSRFTVLRKDPKIGEMLVAEGLIDGDMLREALATQEREGGRIVQKLINLGYIDEPAFRRFLARQPGTASLILDRCEIEKKILEYIPRDFAVAHEIFPVDKLGRLLTVAMVCPLDKVTIRAVEEQTGLKVSPILCDKHQVELAIDKYYPHPEQHEMQTISLDDIS